MADLGGGDMTFRNLFKEEEGKEVEGVEEVDEGKTE